MYVHARYEDSVHVFYDDVKWPCFLRDTAIISSSYHRFAATAGFHGYCPPRNAVLAFSPAVFFCTTQFINAPAAAIDGAVIVVKAVCAGHAERRNLDAMTTFCCCAFLSLSAATC